MWQNIIASQKWLEDLLFPINCINCYQPGHFLCQQCQTLIKPKLEFQCPVCKKVKDNIRVCEGCRSESYLEGLFILTDYNNQLTQKVIQLIKYNFLVDLSDYFGNLIVSYLGNNPDWQPDWQLLPVPLAKKRFLYRGFNQAELICQVINKQFDNKIMPSLLQRVKNTKAQAKLSAKERRNNVRQAFRINPKLVNQLEKKNIVLVDDVYTTGSTMQECAKVLSESGFSNVWGLVIARG